MIRFRRDRKTAATRGGKRHTAAVRLLLPLILCAGFAVGVAVLWHTIRPTLLSNNDYQITADKVDVNPPPPWIRSDVKAAALRDAGLDEPASLLKPDLVQRIARAFSLQPWVAEVERVRKSHPARIEVKLRYRRPVCMIEVPGGLYPVDVDGVVLPSGDFSALEARDYPRSGGITSAPLGPVGTEWGDPKVVGVARIGAALIEHWSRLSLAKIVPAADNPSGAALGDLTFDLHARGGTRIAWGHAPGKETGSEPTAAEKVAWLEQYVADHGPFDGARAPQTLDLKSLPRPLSPDSRAKRDQEALRR